MKPTKQGHKHREYVMCINVTVTDKIILSHILVDPLTVDNKLRL